MFQGGDGEDYVSLRKEEAMLNMLYSNLCYPVAQARLDLWHWGLISRCSAEYYCKQMLWLIQKLENALRKLKVHSELYTDSKLTGLILFGVLSARSEFNVI